MNRKHPVGGVETAGTHFIYLAANLIIVHLCSLAASSTDKTYNAFAPVCPLNENPVFLKDLPDQTRILKQSEVVINRGPTYPKPSSIGHQP